MKINILGKWVDIKIVKEVDMENEDCWGEYLAGKNLIQLSNKHATKESFNYTLFHEALHATIDRLGMELDGNAEEMLVKSIENMVQMNWLLSPKHVGITEDKSKKD